MCNKIVLVEDCSYKSLHEIHNHFTYNLRITDRPLSELLEAILFIKVVAVNWENNLNLRFNVYAGGTIRILNLIKSINTYTKCCILKL